MISHVYLQTDEPGVLETEAVLQSTNCAAPKTVAQLEQLKLENCQSSEDSVSSEWQLSADESSLPNTSVNSE